MNRKLAGEIAAGLNAGTDTHMPAADCGCLFNGVAFIHCPLHAAAPALAEALKLALRYLENPEVQAIPFALSASVAVDRVRAALRDAGIEV